jgi:Zn-dependent oligopeptidase
MDIIKKINKLCGEELIKQIENLISNSKKMREQILSNTNVNSIKLLIEDTFVFDTYNYMINLRLIISDDKNDINNLLLAEKMLKKYNFELNTDVKLLNLIIKLITKTDNKYHKIFLAKMGKSMQKFGTEKYLNSESKESHNKITNIITQLEQTETSLINIIEKPLVIKLDRNNIDARSESIMSSVYPDKQNNIIVDKKRYYYLIKKINNMQIRKTLESQYMKRYIDILPVIGKLIILRSVYSKHLGFDTYYEMSSLKSLEETENIKSLIFDLNENLDKKFIPIIQEIKRMIKKTNKIDFNDIIYILSRLQPDIKLKPVEILQFAMITIQKKLNIFFKHSTIEPLNQHSNVIEVLDSKNNLRGYLHIDLLARKGKKINQISVIKLNSGYGNNLPNMYLMGNYSDLEKNSCTYSELVLMFREFGNILTNIFAITPNGINEIDIELHNIMSDLMEYLAYDKFVLELVIKNLDGQSKIIKDIIEFKKIESIINTKIKCMAVLFDNIIHNSNEFYSVIKKSELNEMNLHILNLQKTVFETIFKTSLSDLECNTNFIYPLLVNNVINNSEGLIYGTILSQIISFTIYKLLSEGKASEFIIQLLENRDYNFKQLILNFITHNDIDYFEIYIKEYLGINTEELPSLYEEDTIRDL